MRFFSRSYYRRQFHRLLVWAEHHMLSLLFLFALLVAAFVVLWPRTFVSIPAGSVGVIYRPLSDGVDLNRLYKEGYYLIWPWNKVTEYSVRVQLKELDLELLTTDLLRTNVKVGFQYELNPLTVPMLHKYVGEDYLNVLIIPQIIAVTRDKVAKFSSKMAYTGDVSTVAREIAITTDNTIINKLSPPGLTNVRLVRVSAVQLLNVNFPPDVQVAIQNKVVEAEIAEAYKFKIQAASQEAIRKKIEATGIRDFQQIVNDNMTENYLIFRGIQATEQLAQSHNTKTLIFGSGPTGLPLILGNALENNSPIVPPAANMALKPIPSLQHSVTSDTKASSPEQKQTQTRTRTQTQTSVIVDKASSSSQPPAESKATDKSTEATHTRSVTLTDQKNISDSKAEPEGKK